MRHLFIFFATFLLWTTSFADTATPTRLNMKTSAGDIVIELNEASAPKTCANFLHYVDTGFYNNTLFHRIITDFMIQGGGFETGMKEKPTQAPVQNESSNGLKNVRGSLAMARTANPDSATTQFFINLVDNHFLDGNRSKPGYTVFGKVITGMEVVDKIVQTRTTVRGPFRDVPETDILILSMTRVAPAPAPAAPAVVPAVVPAAAP